MSLLRVSSLVCDSKILVTTCRQLSTSQCVWNNWRKAQGLEPNPCSYSPLHRLPDFSYVDGRPVPLTMNKRRKLEQQKKYLEKIIELSHELDHAVVRFEEMQKEKEINKETSSKLKPKGINLKIRKFKKESKNSE